MKFRPEWSQRLLRKGVLVQETYEFFVAWNDALSAAENLKAVLSGRFRDELLNSEIFYSLAEAKVILEAWRHYYHRAENAVAEGLHGMSHKIAQKPLALLGDWSVTDGALSACFGHLTACPAGVFAVTGLRWWQR